MTLWPRLSAGHCPDQTRKTRRCRYPDVRCAHHAAEGYLLTLIRKGFRVGVCEQLESPAEAKKRGSKSVVKRDVVRLVTPGTLTEDSLLEARRHNFLAAFADVRGQAALAWVDISTGVFHVMQITRTRLGPELARCPRRN